MNDLTKKRQLWAEYTGLRDGFYLSHTITSLERLLSNHYSRLAEASTWDEVLKIQGEIQGLRAALYEICPQNPDE